MRPATSRRFVRTSAGLRSVFAGAALAVVVATGLAADAALAKETGKVIVSNEKSSTLTILDRTGKVVQTLDTCARPRGMTFNPAHTGFYVGCADDDTIA